MRYLIALLLLASNAFAQPLTIITATGPGSMSDTAARHFAPLLEHELKRPVVVQNLPGGGGVVAMQAFLSSKDSVFIGGTVQGYVAATMPRLDFDPIADIVPIHGLTVTAQQILVPATSDIRKLSDLKGRKLNGGSAHPSTQMTMTLLDAALGSQTLVVGYKQTAQVAIDLASGVIDYTVGAVGNGATQGLIDAGKLRVVGLAGDVPVEEFSWVGWFVKRGSVSPDVTAAIATVMRSDEAKRFEQAGRKLLMTAPAETAALQERELNAIRCLVGDTGKHCK